MVRFFDDDGMNPATSSDMNTRSTVPSPVDTAPVDTSGAGAASILVVDDEATIRDLFMMILQRHGYRVRLAAGGREARRLMAAERPALILSDLHMPEGNGWELLVYCRRHAPGVPVIVFSGSAFGKYPLIESWAASRVTKPFSSGQLLSEVERILPRAPARMLSQTGRAA
ncbi:MAG TPA: response regulator [Opitutaceae bacterium]|nr:response regulator [Opitutaceae bacterium]